MSTHVDPSEFPDRIPAPSAFTGPADPLRDPVSARPATTTTILGGALVIVAGRLGVDLSAEEAVTLVAAATLIVGWFTPRQ